MNLPVDYIDPFGHHRNLTFNLTRLVFVKHMAMAGQAFGFNPRKLFRAAGMLLHYSPYLQSDAFYGHSCFSLPPSLLSDPTEKAQFSNLVGKAIADYLSRRINGSFLTVTYEAAMRYNRIAIAGPRPDLIATDGLSWFAIEAKGRTSGNAGNMGEHKMQAARPIIPVNFSVASVAFNLYSRMRCNYHDPFSENIAYNNDLLRAISRNYYQGFTGFLNQRYFNFREIIIQEERFFEVDLLYNTFTRLARTEDFHLLFGPWFEQFRISLILPAGIDLLAKEGVAGETRKFAPVEEPYRYVDTDRIGISFRPLY